MQAPKTRVLKSKSSNSAIKAPSSTVQSYGQYEHSYKSRSSADFSPTRGAKKRKSMYVEKKSTKISLQCQIDSKLTDKAHCPPRRGRNTFMSSVLTILDKGTRGTQTKAIERTKRKRIVKSDMLHLNNEGIDVNEVKRSQSSIRKQQNQQQTNNTNTLVKKERKPPETLKNELCSRDFIMAPNKHMSTNSDETVTGLKRSSIYDEVADGLLSQLTDEGVVKLLLEDMRTKNKNSRLNSTSRALTSHTRTKEDFEHLKHNINGKLSAKDNEEKGIQNIFVVETTYSCYNGMSTKASYSKTTTNVSVKESKKMFTISVDVDDKEQTDSPQEKFANISFPQGKASNISVKNKDNNEVYKVTNEEIHWEYDDTFQSNIFPEIRSRLKKNCILGTVQRRIRIKSASFNQPNGNNKKLRRVQSVDTFVKYKKKKSNKHKFINMLKQELTKETHLIEEPKNMFQALKIIAKNKKKLQKQMRFTDELTDTSKGGCCYGRKAFIKSKKIKKGVKSEPIARLKRDLSSSFYDTEKENGYGNKMPHDDQSDLSIVVNDFVRDQTLPKKNILYAFNTNERFDDVNDLFKDTSKHENFGRKLNDLDEKKIETKAKDLFERKMNVQQSIQSFKTTKVRITNTTLESESDLPSDLEDISIDLSEY